MDTSFLVAVAAALSFASALIALRMRAGGAPSLSIAVLVAELWATFALWIAAFVSLPRLGRTWAAGMLTMSIIVVAHLLWSLRRAMKGDISG